MTPTEIVERVHKAKHILIVHRGDIFFNSFDYDEVLKWETLGARVVAHWDEDEIARRKKKGRSVHPGWEVHVQPLLDPLIEKDALLAASRATIPSARGNVE